MASIQTVGCMAEQVESIFLFLSGVRVTSSNFSIRVQRGGSPKHQLRLVQGFSCHWHIRHHQFGVQRLGAVCDAFDTDQEMHLVLGNTATLSRYNGGGVLVIIPSCVWHDKHDPADQPN